MIKDELTRSEMENSISELFNFEAENRGDAADFSDAKPFVRECAMVSLERTVFRVSVLRSRYRHSSSLWSALIYQDAHFIVGKYR